MIKIILSPINILLYAVCGIIEYTFEFKDDCGDEEVNEFFDKHQYLCTFISALLAMIPIYNLGCIIYTVVMIKKGKCKFRFKCNHK